MKKPKLSLALVVKNEEAMLERCLESIKGVVDEIVVTDTGSTDKTVQIAKKYTDKVHYFEWVDDFSAAYNYCIAKTTSDYVLKWDADFVLKPSSRKALLELKNAGFAGANHISVILQNIEVDSGLPSSTAPRELIFKKSDFTYSSPVHMYLSAQKSVKQTPIIDRNIVVDHYKDLEVKEFRLSQSYKIIQRSLELDPNNVYLSYHMILGYMYSGEYVEALEAIVHFLITWPDYIPERVLMVLQYKFECLLQLGRVEETKCILEDFTRLTDFPQYKLLRADIAAVQKDPDAMKLYQDYLALNFLSSDTNFGYFYYRNMAHPRIMLARLIVKTDPELAASYLTELNNYSSYFDSAKESQAVAKALGLKLQ